MVKAVRRFVGTAPPVEADTDRTPMGAARRLWWVALLIGGVSIFGSGCYTSWLVRDPSVHLEPGAPQFLDSIPARACIEVTPRSASYTYRVDSRAAGRSKPQTIYLGEALVRYSDAYLRPAFDKGEELVITIHVIDFLVKNFEARLGLRFEVMKEADLVFSKEYRGKGRGHFAPVAFGGGVFMRSSMQRTTDEALRQVFLDFHADATELHASWLGEKSLSSE
jgi:hypothetical protein